MTRLADSPHFQQGLADAVDDDQPGCDNPATFDRLARLFYPDRIIDTERGKAAS